jgi:ElaB/YqjD/DUF883 family membrane-anchored ribosome-binding protein
MAERNGTTTATSGVDSLKDSVKHLVEQGQDKVGELKTKFFDVKDRVMTEGSSLLSSSRAWIRDNPLMAIGIAFGVGYFGMRIFRR